MTFTIQPDISSLSVWHGFSHQGLPLQWPTTNLTRTRGIELAIPYGHETQMTTWYVLMVCLVSFMGDRTDKT